MQIQRRDNYNEKLAEYLKGHDVIPVCPEVEGGLPVPRRSCEIVGGVVTNTDGESRDAEFRKGAELCLKKAFEENIDFAVLQSRSPSCGVKQVYDGTFSGALIPGEGIFAKLLRENGFKAVDIADLETEWPGMMIRTAGLETERLIINGIKPGDKEDYFLNISHDKRVLETFVCNYAETPAELDITPYTANDAMFAIRLKETGKLIGIILYFDETEDSCEIGYGIGSGYWNKGYGTEAVKRFIEYLIDQKGFKTVYASYFTGNDASRRIMEKCGMVYDRFSEKEMEYLGEEKDLTYYRISRQ